MKDPFYVGCVGRKLGDARVKKVKLINVILYFVVIGYGAIEYHWHASRWRWSLLWYWIKTTAIWNDNDDEDNDDGDEEASMVLIKPEVFQ